MADEVPWNKMRVDNALKAIDFIRESISEAGKGLGPAAGMGEFMFNVGNYEQLMDLTMGLKDVTLLLLERTGAEQDTLLEISSDLRAKDA